MDKKYAVIDLGTNTFHLLIAEKGKNGLFNELFRHRIFVQLAENGIQHIGEAPKRRGIDALLNFKEVLNEHAVKNVLAFGTAALRTANNGNDFIREVFEKTGIQIQLIPGDREANLIYKGVIQAVEVRQDHVLIMDIGGGSVEFIIANNEKVKWAQSFPVGVAVLHQGFHKNDPISEQEVNRLYTYLNEKLSPLIDQLNTYKPQILVGASGTFDVLESLLCDEKISPVHGIVNTKDFHPLFKQLLHSTLSERLKNPGIPDSRAELIIVALILIDFILSQTPIQTISVSAYAMKEGMLQEAMEGNL